MSSQQAGSFLEYNTFMEFSIGAQLKQIRESQGIDLETIAQKTHISVAYLRALEAGNLDLLPSKVHVSGFSRLYAHELGIELDDLSVSGYHLTKDKHAQPITEKGEFSVEDQPVTDDNPTIPVTEISLLDRETFVEDVSSIAEPSPENIQVGIDLPEPVLKDSEHILITIGEKIKKQRQLHGLSINEVYENLHIPTQHLMSIESGRFEKLPSPTQAKGLLVNYAVFLNLDTEALLTDYVEALQLRRLEKQELETKKEKHLARELSPNALRVKNFLTLDLLVIAILFLAFSTFVIWGVNRILANTKTEVVEDDIPGISDVLLAAETPTLIPTTDIKTTVETENEEDDEENLATELEEEPLFPFIESSDPINIILIPRQRLWVQVTVDGKQVFQGRLIPGNAYEYSGQEQIDILTGNVGALQVLFNNQEIGSQGLLGQVANLSFTTKGLVLPAPTSTPVSTSTPQITPTLLESDG